MVAYFMGFVAVLEHLQESQEFYLSQRIVKSVVQLLWCVRR